MLSQFPQTSSLEEQEADSMCDERKINVNDTDDDDDDNMDMPPDLSHQAERALRGMRKRHSRNQGYAPDNDNDDDELVTSQSDHQRFYQSTRGKANLASLRDTLRRTSSGIDTREIDWELQRNQSLQRNSKDIVVESRPENPTAEIGGDEKDMEGGPMRKTSMSQRFRHCVSSAPQDMEPTLAALTTGNHHQDKDEDEEPKKHVPSTKKSIMGTLSPSRNISWHRAGNALAPEQHRDNGTKRAQQQSLSLSDHIVRRLPLRRSMDDSAAGSNNNTNKHLRRFSMRRSMDNLAGLHSNGRRSSTRMDNAPARLSVSDHHHHHRPQQQQRRGTAVGRRSRKLSLSTSLMLRSSLNDAIEDWSSSSSTKRTRSPPRMSVTTRNWLGLDDINSNTHERTTKPIKLGDKIRNVLHYGSDDGSEVSSVTSSNTAKLVGRLNRLANIHDSSGVHSESSYDDDDDDDDDDCFSMADDDNYHDDDDDDDDENDDNDESDSVSREEWRALQASLRKGGLLTSAAVIHQRLQCVVKKEKQKMGQDNSAPPTKTRSPSTYCRPSWKVETEEDYTANLNECIAPHQATLTRLEQLELRRLRLSTGPSLPLPNP